MSNLFKLWNIIIMLHYQSITLNCWKIAHSRQQSTVQSMTFIETIQHCCAVDSVVIAYQQCIAVDHWWNIKSTDRTVQLVDGGAK